MNIVTGLDQSGLRKSVDKLLALQALGFDTYIPEVQAAWDQHKAETLVSKLQPGMQLFTRMCFASHVWPGLQHT